MPHSRVRSAPSAAVLTASISLVVNACAIDPNASYPSPEGERMDRIAEVAMEMRGEPYRFGGTAPGGFDCSGLVQYAYAQAGFDVPRTAQRQYESIRRLYLHQLNPGDLVFFRTRGRNFVSHVGIYVGDDQFVHALNRELPVHTARLDDPYWQRRLVGAGSLIQ